jgi:hypothetical protein
MGAVILDMADAVVNAINAATLPETVEAVRSYRPINELPDLATLKVFVSPRSMELTSDTRGTPQRQIVIDVGVQKKFDDESEIADLVELVEAIAILFHGNVTTITGGRGMCVSANPDPIYDTASIEQRRLFASVVTLTFEYYGG